MLIKGQMVDDKKTELVTAVRPGLQKQKGDIISPGKTSE